jgi:hypothetical protein
MLNKLDIEQCRTPTELRSYVMKIQKNARASEDDRKAGYLRSGLYKEFFDELVPLSIFCNQYYNDDVNIKPVIGSQGYDAEIIGKDGSVLERIEIAYPIDGVKRAEENQQVVSNGASELDVYEPGEDLEDLRKYIEGTCKKKSLKDYSDCIIIIAITHIPPDKLFENIYEEKLREIGEYVRSIKFNAKKVFLVVVNEYKIIEI